MANSQSIQDGLRSIVCVRYGEMSNNDKIDNLPMRRTSAITLKHIIEDCPTYSGGGLNFEDIYNLTYEALRWLTNLELFVMKNILKRNVNTELVLAIDRNRMMNTNRTVKRFYTKPV